ncbi:putative F-box protein At1g67390 [Quercus lobata]|uniref:putative F-box protein At1g67390 n=1 Tax=Quercus lobata TaxID=97700 RepID=UPI001247150E|nr:putative F-box protein At1g67390 [Quercus lobata]
MESVLSKWNGVSMNDKEEVVGAEDHKRMSDHISELPDDILINILSSLTLRDAVKARSLSPRWRHLSAPISTLQFDLFTMFGIEYDENKGYFDTLPANFVNELKPRFLTSVDQFLQQYMAPKIGTLMVHFLSWQ